MQRGRSKRAPQRERLPVDGGYPLLAKAHLRGLTRFFWNEQYVQSGKRLPGSPARVWCVLSIPEFYFGGGMRKVWMLPAAISRVVFALALMAVLIPGRMLAQFGASMNGTVQDPTGAVVPGATVTLTNQANQQSRTVTSSPTAGSALRSWHRGRTS